MIEHVYFRDNKAHVIYNFSDEDVEVLSELKRYGFIEFKQDADSSIVDNLYAGGFVTSDDDAWHSTYILTDLGKSIVRVIPKL